ncbi:MAG: hypothetical protein H5T96_01380 [Tissierellales bacterium]|nr:hypothetical protein [Tissierellales bacterium]
MIERACILANTNFIEISDINIDKEDKYDFEKEIEIETNEFRVDQFVNLDELNKRYIEYVLKRKSGSMKEASKILGVDRSTIWRKLKQ